MSNPDGIEGIGGDRNFIDHLYLYYKLKKELFENKNNPIEEKEKVESSLCEHYLCAVDRCLMKIQKLSNDSENKRSYLNWLRWNIDVIIAELDQYEEIPHLSNLVTAISNCKNNIRITAENHFQFSETEKAISNQYVHAYQRVTRPGKCPETVYKHTGKLFINYVNLLKNRCYIKKLDRDGVTFAHLEAEADYLMKKLKDVDEDLAFRIKTINEMYAQIRLMDDTLRHNEDENVEKALILAHIRTQESFLEAVRRQTREAISLIKLRLLENIKMAWDAASVLVSPVRHPIDGVKNMWYFISNTLESVEEIGKYVKVNPWKSAFIVLGGFCIGFVSGATIFAGGASLFDYLLTQVVIPHSSLILIGSIGGGIGGAAIPMALAGAKVVKIKAKSGEEMALENIREKARIDALSAVNEEEGRRIANQVLYEEHKRQMIKKAQEIAEEEIRIMQEEQQRIEEERKRQINSMSREELEALHGQLLTSEQELASNLKKTQTELVERQMEFRQSQLDICKVREGLSACSRLMQNVTKTTGLPSEQLNCSDSGPVTSNGQSNSSVEAVNETTSSFCVSFPDTANMEVTKPAPNTGIHH